MDELTLKYHNLDDLCERMLSYRPGNRPTCKDILDIKKSWGLDKGDFNFEEELISKTILET
jgi:hypothetical protein